MSLGYPFSYGDELTPETARLNRLNLFLFLSRFILLNAEPVYAQFVDGFAIPNISWRPICQNYGIFSKLITNFTTVLQENPNTNNGAGPNTIIEYVSELGYRIDYRQLQRNLSMFQTSVCTKICASMYVFM